MRAPILIGYFPKRRTLPPDWVNPVNVTEICSVSECIVSGPDDWIQAWRHNDWGFFDTPELAWSVVPDSSSGEFDLYAYELFEQRFVGGKEEPLEIDAPGVAPMDGSFEMLGHDVVSRSVGTSFECSPLSCNHWAEEVGANAFCLVNDVNEAFRLGSIAEASKCEPGDYFVFRVWRRRRGGGNPTP